MGIDSRKPPEGQNLNDRARRADNNDPIQEKSPSGKEIAGMINFSSRARLIIELRRAVARLPEIRGDKVRTIQKALADGTYEIDSRKIAERLINEAI